ncbi:cytochrome P450 family protein [Streptomyces pactum]|uniref:cytochrome P450 family protein n=1 Tax=Streptomyces pactum TaxID=68249 RepID=UPI0036F72EDD
MEPSACPVVLDPEGADLHGEADRLRARGPATRVLLPGGVPAWSVTSDRWIRRLAGDRRVSRDSRRHWPALADIPDDWPLRFWVGGSSALAAYGEDHRRLRDLLAPSFTPRRAERLRPRVEAVVGGLIDRLRRDEREVVDLRAEFAVPIPTEVIFGLFGVPDDLHDAMHRAVNATVRTAATPAEAAAALKELAECLAALVEYKSREPGEDMTSDLIAARRDGRLTDRELTGSLHLMLGAGSETAVNLLAGSVHALVTDPGQAALLRAGRVGWDDVIEETLRHQGPLIHMPLRYAVEDIDLDEHTRIRKGDAILLAFGAAGRDPEVHGPTRHDYDAARPNKQHLAFGYGVHYCLGAALARMEAAVALPALFTAFPRMTPAVPREELRPLPSFIVNGYRALPVRLRG